MSETTPAKELLKELKKAGLNIAEDAVADVVRAVFEALPNYFLATENKIDDVAVAILPILKPYVMQAIDKIDGEVDSE